MKAKEYNFLIFSLYGFYSVMIGHYVLTENQSTFLSYFSEWGIYTLLIFLGLHSIFLIKNEKLAEKINKVKSKKFGYTIITFLASHLITFFHPLLKISDLLANILIWNESFILFIIGSLMFIWGVILLKNGADKKYLITICMILFIHGFYNILFLSSINKQLESFENVYKSVVSHNLEFKECEKEVSCAKFNEKDRKEILNKVANDNKEETTKKAMQIYMSNLSKKIDENKDDITSYSYLNSPIGFIQNYQVISVYSKKNGYLIIDYQKPNKISKDHINTYKRLLGTATIMWLGLLLFLNLFHDIFLKYRLKNQKQNEDRNSNE